MKKTLVLIASMGLFLSACSSGPVDDNKTAECSQIMGRVIQAPAVQQRNPGDNFLAQYQRDKSAEAAREHAKKAGCLEKK
ncbi:hypothetical protein V757_06020 [Pelistega indica]|uniref:Lipoprotein n=1 Tax=Pelistega indica TaxID=1414851 RepID=V8G858_9BURK|nr:MULTISPECIES: hypothetical protein [Pelistega]ETD72138.1 hypothetical protein V757_06020 [Pelistega indica]